MSDKSDKIGKQVSRLLASVETIENRVLKVISAILVLFLISISFAIVAVSSPAIALIKVIKTKLSRGGK